MRVLVTGATGFTGGHLARTLARKGYDVRALVRSEKKGDALKRDGIQTVVGDVRDLKSVEQAADGCDVVYHLAAMYRQARHSDNVYRQVNVGGTENVLKACGTKRIGRFVHCSTVGVHGDVKAPADETAPFAPMDQYQQSKLDGEILARKYMDAGTSGVIFRPVGIHGPGDMRFHKLFRTVSNGAFRMIGTGEVLYHMTYIDDLVEGIILCGEHPAAVGQTYILSGPRYTTVTELVQTVAKAVGKKPPRGRIPVWPVMMAAVACESLCRPLHIEPPLHRRRLEFFVNDRGFSSAKAKRELGFAPRVSLEEGLSRTAAWYRSERLL